MAHCNGTPWMPSRGEGAGKTTLWGLYHPTKSTITLKLTANCKGDVQETAFRYSSRRYHRCMLLKEPNLKLR